MTASAWRSVIFGLCSPSRRLIVSFAVSDKSKLTPRLLTGRSKVQGMPSSMHRTHRASPSLREHLEPLRWHLSQARCRQLSQPPDEVELLTVTRLRLDVAPLSRGDGIMSF